MCTISIIAAKSRNNVIGNNNLLPWYLPSDLQHFRNLTMQSVVLMGRKTFESIGKPLPHRHNVVISSNREWKAPEGVMVCPDPRTALKASRVICMQHTLPNIYVIGGASVYQTFIKRADRMILTTIDAECTGDTFFPQFKTELWELQGINKHHDPKGYLLEKPANVGLNYTIEDYERIL